MKGQQPWPARKSSFVLFLQEMIFSQPLYTKVTSTILVTSPWDHNFWIKIITITIRVPTQTGKPGKMGRHFPVREKSGNFEQTGKVREKSGKFTQNTGKLKEFEINII